MNSRPSPRPQIAAILVVYEARARAPDVVGHLAAAVPHVIVVDNAPAASAALSPDVIDPRATLLRNGNRGGLAGAYNAALRHVFRNLPQVAHVVFVDDDTDCTSLAAFACAEETQIALRQQATAAVGPAYRDRATGLRGAHLILSRFMLHSLPREFAGMRRVSFLINSMSIWSVAALRRLGPYNEDLAVDHVDTEYCVRAQQLGLDLFVNGDFEFAHSIGRRRAYRFMGKTLQAGGHSALRRAMIGRNTAWLARRHLLRWPAFALLCMLRLAYEGIGIVMVEDHKAHKLRGLLAGMVQGFFGSGISGVAVRQWQVE